MGTLAAVGLASAKLVGAGVCLGLGFWVSKQITKKLDYYLVLHDKEFNQELRDMSASAMVH
jgi:hypothetical protein